MSDKIIYTSYRDDDENNFDISSMSVEDLDSTNALLAAALDAFTMNDDEENLLVEYIDALKSLIEHQKQFNNLRKLFLDKSLLISFVGSYNRADAYYIQSLAKGEAIAISNCKERIAILESSEILQDILNRDDCEISEQEEEIGIECQEVEERASVQNIIEQPTEKRTNLFLSKRIASTISLLLCVTLYLLFLTMAFTNKRDTYICYTTKTGECYHSATCQYISKSAYETTVYKASKKFRPCSRCNPCIERYATTFTERNYVVPLLISAPISAAVFYLLTYKKEDT